MLAVAVEEEVQSTLLVTSCIVPSLIVAMDVNWMVVVTGMNELIGVIEMDLILGETVSVVDPETPPILPVMVVVPTAKLFANPDADTVATAVDDDDQVTCIVRSI